LNATEAEILKVQNSIEAVELKINKTEEKIIENEDALEAANTKYNAPTSNNYSSSVDVDEIVLKCTNNLLL
jgi:predicted  nucleic acid-binding Zn-ribbon protein